MLYNLLIILFSPLLACYYLWRVFGSKKAKESWRQQVGRLPESVKRTSKARSRVWIQTVSVGETVASAPILRELKALLPNVEIVVSTTTTTGQAMARKILKEADQIIYFPLDIRPFVRRSLSIVDPDVFVSVESEIWPNFLAAARKRKVPTLIVNGIVSDNTVRWGRRLRFVYRWALGNVSRLLMQSKADANRIIELGAASERVTVAGNCKFDQEADALSPEQVREIRERLGFATADRIIVAGSTNPGEDEQVLEAFSIARQSHSDLKLVIAPRQIERAAQIAEMAESLGFSCGQRSISGSLSGNQDVAILDTFGELAGTYGIADVAFVGGSLIPKGGHNILQPIAQGKPVLYGPYTFKSRDLVRLAESAGVGFAVRDAEDLGKQISGMLNDASRLADIRERADKMMADNRGASKRCAEAIVSVLRLK